jgi:hypothetical protein
MATTNTAPTSMTDGYTYNSSLGTWVLPPAPWESHPKVKAAEKKLMEARATFDAVDAVWISAVQKAAEIRLAGVGGPTLMTIDGGAFIDRSGNAEAKARDFRETELAAATERRDRAWSAVVAAQSLVAAEIRRATAQALDA